MRSAAGSESQVSRFGNFREVRVLANGGRTPSELLVIFGIAGDLDRKMTYRARYRLKAHGLLNCPIVGVVSDDMPVEKLVERARRVISESGEKRRPTIEVGRRGYDPGSWRPEAVAGAKAA